jgi:hypothetical protein
MKRIFLIMLSVTFLSCNQFKQETSNASSNTQPVNSSNPIWASVPNISSVLSNSAILDLIDSSSQLSTYQIKYDADTLLTKTDNNVTQAWLQEQNGIGILVFTIVDSKILSFDRYIIKELQNQPIKIDFSNLINGKTVKDVQIASSSETDDQIFSRIKAAVNPMYSQYTKSQASVAICAQCSSALQDYKDALAQLLINSAQIGTGWAGQYIVTLNAALKELGSALALREIAKIALKRAFAGNVPNAILTIVNAAWTTYQIYVSTKYIIALQNYEKCLRKYYNLNTSDPNSCKLDSIGSLNPNFQRSSSEVGKIITLTTQYTSSSLREVFFQTQSRGTPANINPAIGSISKGQTVKFAVLFECLAPGDFDVFIDVDFDYLLKPTKGSNDTDFSQRRTAQFTISCTDPYGIAVSIPAQVNLGQQKFGSTTKQFIKLSNLSRANLFFSISGARDWLSLENANSLISFSQSTVGFYAIGKCSNKPADEAISLAVQVVYAANTRFTTKTYPLSVTIKCVGAPAISNVALEAAFDKLAPFGGDQANVLTFTNSGDANLEYAVSTTFSPTSPAWIVFTGASGYNGQTGVAAPGQRVRIAVKGTCGNKVQGLPYVLFTVRGTAYPGAPVGYSAWVYAECKGQDRLLLRPAVPSIIYNTPTKDDNSAYAESTVSAVFTNVGPGAMNFSLNVDTSRVTLVSRKTGILAENQPETVSIKVKCKPYISNTDLGDSFGKIPLYLYINYTDTQRGKQAFVDVRCGRIASFKRTIDSPNFIRGTFATVYVSEDTAESGGTTPCVTPISNWTSVAVHNVHYSFGADTSLEFQNYFGPETNKAKISSFFAKAGTSSSEEVCPPLDGLIAMEAFQRQALTVDVPGASVNLRNLLLSNTMDSFLYLENKILDVTTTKISGNDSLLQGNNLFAEYATQIKILSFPQ